MQRGPGHPGPPASTELVSWSLVERAALLVEALEPALQRLVVAAGEGCVEGVDHVGRRHVVVDAAAGRVEQRSNRVTAEGVEATPALRENLEQRHARERILEYGRELRIRRVRRGPAIEVLLLLP